MNEKQAEDTVNMMNIMWSRQTLEGPARDLMEAKLRTVDHATAKRALTRLHDTSKWMPSWRASLTSRASFARCSLPLVHVDAFR